MGNLKPIGSEKLQGMDKINRILEITRYKENTPNSINEDKSVEFTKTLIDGKNYQIVKEKTGYVLKKQVNESSFDYVEPMKNRKYYSSYSQALKRLNLIAKEVNVSEGYDRNVSLFTENNDEKFYLKLKSETNEQSQPIPASPAPAAVAPSPAPADVPTEEPIDVPTDDTELPMDDELPTDEVDTQDEVVTLKTIQKLTGKLAQKLRVFSSNEEEPMTSNDIKYVINSILSALDLNLLEPDDLEQIVAKFEGDEDMGDEDMGGLDNTGEDMSEPEGEVTEPVADGEMGEQLDIEDGKDMLKNIFTDAPVPPREKVRKLNHYSLKDNEADKMEEMIEGIFSESKVDNILKKYFKIDEKEKTLLEEKRNRLNNENKNYNVIVSRVKKISESISQEVTTTKILKKNPTAKLLGKTKSHNIVLEVNNKKIRINPKGQIL